MSARLGWSVGMLVGSTALAVGLVAPVLGWDGPEPQAADGSRSVNDGVYTSAQARHGEGLFRDLCSSCHTLDQFTGAAFVDSWPGPLDTFFDSIRTTMPDDNPGSLAPEVYADVTAYFLSLNGYPTGDTPLGATSEAMHNVRLEPLGASPAPAAEPAPGAAASSAPAGVIEASAEARFQLDLHVPDSAISAMLPPGFTLSVATQGPAKDANLRAIFVDRLTINGPDGAPVGTGSNRLVYLAAPVKDPSGANAQLVIGGLTADAADAPGPFGNYLHATTATMKRTISGEGPTVTETDDWVFQAASGEHLEMHITFERGVGARRNASDTKYYSAKNPSMSQTAKQEQVLEILRNATTNPPDKVKQFSFKGSGGSYATLFDGTEKPVSWDNIIWMMRTVSTP